MAKRRKKKSIKKGAVAPQHNVPDGFWSQAGAVMLVVLAVLLIVALFGAGGPVLLGLLKILTWLLGATVVILPFLLVYRSIQIFRVEHNRVPAVVTIASVFFIVQLAGLAELLLKGGVDGSRGLVPANGGEIGHLVARLLLALTDKSVAILVLVVIAILTSLFVVSISPKAVIDWIKNLFTRDDSAYKENNSNIASRMNNDQKTLKSAPIHGLKLNEGVPTTMSANVGDEKGSRASRLSSLKGSIRPDKVAEEQAALITGTDPDWVLPDIDLLEKKQSPADAGDVKRNAQIIRDTLTEFNIEVDMEGANIGPKVTQYTLKPPSGVKLAKITQLEQNIALNLAAQSLRIEAPIPGQSAVGIEVPNRKAADVRLYGILSSRSWKSETEPLSFAIGKDIAGEAVVGQLNKLPHLLIAGQTGSGKSVMINTLLTSLLYKNSPSDMRLILVDPKQVEMAPYEEIPHLLTPIITEPEKCISALKWAVNEMERRYSLLAEEKLRDIKSYNQRRNDQAMPYIVIVIDELADLMMVAARDVEALIVRIAQKARAVGIHLVLATQRPSVDVITGLIKANIPGRIAFTVASQVDSRTILDQIGAEKLLGQGDMLLLTPAMSKPKRIQGAWVTDDEVVKITDHLRMQRPPQYDNEVVAQQVQLSGRGSIVMDMEGGEGDDMYKDAVKCVIDSGKASTSLLQRRLRIGYSRAARIMEMMEEQGVIGPADGARPREVLMGCLEDLSSADVDT
jgi:S-DNA-T family DNA segregation ATPase FtsK/SpoIIIE